MAKPIRVLLDVTLFGHVHDHPHVGHARAGIFRVVERTATSLAATPQVALTLCAPHRAASSHAYVRAHRELRALRFALPRRRQVGGRLSERVLQAYRHAGAHPPNMLPVRVANSMLAVANRAIDGTRARVGLQSRVRADVFHSPVYPLPGAGQRTRQVRYFLTVHDLIPLLHPEYFSRTVVRDVARTIDSIGPDDHVLTVSESTRQDLLGARRDLAPERVRVSHLAADPARFYRCQDPDRVAAVRAKYGVPDAPYVLSVGTLEPRKNLPHLIRSFAEAARGGRLGDLHLVLTGDPGWDYEAIFAHADREADLRDRIVFTGYVDDEDLAPLYTGATAFAYPSLYEGFGLPPLEAMQCGAPVITSNTSSLPEVVGDAGLLVDPRDPDALAQALLDVYEDGALRAELSRRSRARAAMFTWPGYAERVVAAYRATL